MSVADDLQVLFVDDQTEVLTIVREYLKTLGYSIDTANGGDEALEKIDAKSYDIVFTDLKMPGIDGLAVLTEVKKAIPICEVVIVTGHGTVETAVEAIKLGAYDYLQKPIELDRLRILIDRIAEKQQLQKENLQLQRQLKERSRYDGLVGVSRPMQRIYEIIDRIREDEPTVLIQGESGTGKEIVAKVIHNRSPRKGGPFVAVNCGAFVEGLLESELFGHMKGSFTGAVRDKMGLFQAAEGGTLFLDEIAEVNPSIQVKLLRVLQEMTVRPVGDTREFPIDVRVIAATNRDLDQAMKTEQFRKDLYYRLNVVGIRMAPLSERREDISLLANHFIEKFSAKRRKEISAITTQAMNVLLSYPWPGNVRELENVIERAFALGSGGELDVADLPAELREHNRSSENVDPPLMSLQANEIRLIRHALRHTSGNKAKVAELLGINITTVYRKMEKYGLSYP